MRYRTHSIAVIIALLAVGAPAASAQNPQTRQGFWIGFGFGWGSYGISCSGCGSEREGSYTGHIKMGGTVGPKLLLGGETVAWTKTEGDATISAGNVTFNAQYYPRASGGFFVNAGVGFSHIELSGGGFSAGETGPGFTVGTGYDIRVGRNVSITPIGQFVYGHPDSGFNHNFFHFALGVTFH